MPYSWLNRGCCRPRGRRTALRKLRTPRVLRSILQTGMNCSGSCALRWAKKQQISERQRAETELHKLGVELLFHTYIDRFTFAEITHNTAAHKYDAIIYLDERVTNEEKRANAAAMRKAFDAWLEKNGLTADPTALTEVPDPCEGRFDTLAGAIAHIDHILRFPDLLLI